MIKQHMSQVISRVFSLFVVCVAILTLPACHNKQLVAAPPNDSVHARALAVAAQGVGFEPKQPERAIECFQRAIQLEPDNHEWKADLAFAFYKDHRNPEAIPIWQELAKGTDDHALLSKRFLTQVAAR
jgi:tetratricopeptide (TPR) repeat protein